MTMRSGMSKCDGEGALAGYIVSGPDVAFSGENLDRTLGADVRLPVTALLTK